MTEAIERASFPGLNACRQHASIVGEILRQKLWEDLLDQSRMALPNARSWRPIRED